MYGVRARVGAAGVSDSARRYPLFECACGCGQTLTTLDKRGRPRQFISGHNGRGTVVRLNLARDAARAYFKVEAQS